MIDDKKALAFLEDLRGVLKNHNVSIRRRELSFGGGGYVGLDFDCLDWPGFNLEFGRYVDGDGLAEQIALLRKKGGND